MEKQFIADLVANARVESVFAVKDKSLVSFRNKPGKFLNLTLVDCSGEMTGRMWDNAEEAAEGFGVGDAVLARGSIQEYQGQLQLITTQIAKAEPDSYDVDDLIARGGRSAEELQRWLGEILDSVADPHLRALLDTFFGAPEFMTPFADAFGAKSLHHAYAGGLLEHTLSVTQILIDVHRLHPEMNRDLLITGALLHDIGKVWELGGTMTADYTDVGRLIGHTVLADRLVNERIAQIEGFDPILANLLSHMILSHHGEREWGAPITPAIMEACALHYADNLDARVQGFKHIIQSSAGGDSNWSEYHRSYQRQIYLGSTSPDADAEPDEPEQDDAGTADEAPDPEPGIGQLPL